MRGGGETQPCANVLFMENKQILDGGPAELACWLASVYYTIPLGRLFFQPYVVVANSCMYVPFLCYVWQVRNVFFRANCKNIVWGGEKDRQLCESSLYGH